MTAKRLAGKKLAIVPILRAGLGMTDGILVPSACEPELDISVYIEIPKRKGCRVFC